MKYRQLTLKSGDDLAKLSTFLSENTDFALIFCSPSIARDQSLVQALAGVKVPVIGCSTAGEISSDGVEDGSLVCTAVQFEKGSKIKVASGKVGDANQSFAAGEELAKTLKGDGLKSIFMLGTGTNVNGSELIRGVVATVDSDVKLSGGLAGDNMSFDRTFTILNGTVETNRAVALGFYGDAIEISSASQGGWKPFGPPRRVTRAEGNVLYELDGQSALSIYETYLGEKAKDLPGTGLMYPFAIVEGANESSGLIRTILGMDREKGSLILAGDIPSNGLLRLMHAGIDGLVDGAERAAEQVAVNQPENALAILVSCVGRKGVMGEDTEDELDAVKGALPDGTMCTGFYSYGEISFFEKTNAVELHNQTMTITLLSEK